MKYTVIPTSFFQKDVKQLARKYKLIKKDLSDAIENLERGNLGNAIQPQPSSHGKVFKMRLKNSTAQKGTRSGFRLITLILEGNEIYLLSCYSKSDFNDIENSEIERRVNMLSFED